MGGFSRIHIAVQALFDDPVDLQIRVTADRGGEMGIVFRRQSKMTGVQGRIFRLFHRAQRQTAEQCLLRRALDLFKQLLQLFRVDFAARHPQCISKVVDERAEFRHLLLIRFLMDSVEERHFLPIIVLGYRLICHQHEILDKLRRRVALIRLDLDRASFGVE